MTTAKFATFGVIKLKYFMNFTPILGLIAASCTTASFIPQVIKILRTGETKEISLKMYIILTFGTACWLAYGIMLKDAPIILANTITLILASTILVLKIKKG